MNIHNKINSEKNQLLEQFIKSVPFEGWTLRNFKNAEVTCGFKDNYHLLLFPNKLADLTQFYHESLNEKMTKTFLESNTHVKISAKIIYLVELKLELYAKNKEAIRGLMKYNTLPQNAISAQKRLWNTCDQIWFLSDDKSTDYNYYTKRSLLAAIYTATLFYFLDDDSENYQNTRDFLRRKIKNIGIIPQIKSKVSRFFKELFS